MTTRYFIAVVVSLPFALAAGLWAYAFSLCGRTGRLVLTAGLFLVFEARRGRHEMLDEPPTYEGEPVRVRDHRTEDERAAAYALMRAETQAMPVTVSAAPYTAWTAALHPTDLDELRASLDAVVTDFQRDLTAKLDAVVSEFLRERTGEQALIPA